MGKWKGVQYKTKNRKNTEIELYDLENDIFETTDLASEYPEIVKRIEVLFEEARVESVMFPLK